MPTSTSAAPTPVLTIPESAVMDTGRRQAVFVDKGEGRFEPREVKLGQRGGGYVEVREGISEGEPVVISANFLIDAESNLKAALKGFADGSAAMIARLIAWSARNLLLVLFGAGFAAAAGIYALAHLPLDAIPDLSDTQVIVYTEYPGQAPQVIEDQVTYPLTTAMLTVPRSKVVRGFSFFGVSFVYVIFEDGTDIYWARSRVLEFLNGAASRLPAGVTPTMGPDATGVGWVYQYAVMSKELNLADTRAIQDWNLKFALAKAEGVAEVASVGGFVRQYNVILDPQRMRDLGITMQKMRDAIRASNADVGGRTVELSEFEYVIRGKGYIKGINDLGNIVLKTERRDAGAAQGRRPRRTRPRRAARHHRTQRRRRSRQRHRAAAFRRQCAGRDPEREEADLRRSPAACRNRPRSSRSMTAPT